MRCTPLRTNSAPVVLVGGLLLLLGMALPAEAARPPIGKTYYTVLMGLVQPYETTTSCFEFGRNDLCSTDGDTCGSWTKTDRQGNQTGFTFDLTVLEDGNPVRIQGRGRVDGIGRRSSIGGTGRISGAGPIFNYSFAGREMGRERCQQLLGGGSDGSDGGDGVLIVGSGVVASVSREVSGFSKVALSGVGRLRIRHTGVESLTVTADDNLLPYMQSEVRDGVLVLGNDAGVNFRTDNEIFYDLTVRDLDALTVTGVTAVDVRGIDTDLFKVDVSGVAAVTVKGSADRQQAVVSGVALYDASGLKSQIVDINVSGVSTATVRVSEQLNGRVQGLSTLEYIGNPTVNVSVDPSSSLKRLP